MTACPCFFPQSFSWVALHNFVFIIHSFPQNMERRLWVRLCGWFLKWGKRAAQLWKALLSHRLKVPGALVSSRLGLPWIDLAYGCFTYMLALLNDGKFAQIKLIFMFFLGLPPLWGPKCFIGGVIPLPSILALTYLVSFPVPVKKCWTTL